MRGYIYIKYVKETFFALVRILVCLHPSYIYVVIYSLTAQYYPSFEQFGWYIKLRQVDKL